MLIVQLKRDLKTELGVKDRCVGDKVCVYTRRRFTAINLTSKCGIRRILTQSGFVQNNLRHLFRNTKL